MSNNKENRQDTQLLGKRLIESAINIDLSLAELLKAEAIKIKKQIKKGESMDDMQKTISIIRNIILCLTMTDDKIRNGMELINTRENDIDSK